MNKWQGRETTEVTLRNQSYVSSLTLHLKDGTEVRIPPHKAAVVELDREGKFLRVIKWD